MNLAALDRAAIHRPVAVREIHERLVPYRTHRSALGLDTHEDYELTLLRLLAGERGLATAFPEDVRVAIVREAASVNPDTALFRRFPEATLVLNPERAAEVLGGVSAQAGSDSSFVERGTGEAAASHPATGSDDVPPFTALIEEAGIGEPADAPLAGDEETDVGHLPFALEEELEDGERPAGRPREITGVTAPCPYCGGGLPVGRTVLFCPHCGQNIGVVHCPTCGSELDVGWGFCITCGQKVTGLG